MILSRDIQRIAITISKIANTITKSIVYIHISSSIDVSKYNMCTKKMRTIISRVSRHLPLSLSARKMSGYAKVGDNIHMYKLKKIHDNILIMSIQSQSYECELCEFVCRVLLFTSEFLK